MKRLLCAILIALLLLSITACAESSEPTVPETVPATQATETTMPPDKLTANHLSYPIRLGETVLGEEMAMELYHSAPAYLAEIQISNVADALFYMRSMADAGVSFDQPYDVCKVFVQLLAGDYEEVGLIVLRCEDNGYVVAYVQHEGYCYPFDIFAWYRNPRNYTWLFFKDYKDFTDMNSLAEKLMKTFPYNQNLQPMTSWSKELVATYRSQQERDLMQYLITPQYTQEQLDQWVSEDLTLEQWAEKITVPADAIAALNALGYGTMLYNDNMEVSRTGGVHWCGIWNAQKVFEMRSGNCGGTSHIMNALLSGDFDEQGYVEYNGNYGGHIYNYFVKDGVYALCDFVGLFTSERTYIGEGPTDYIVYLGSDLQAFADSYMNEWGHNDPENSEYIYHLFMYPQEGVKHPKGFDSKSPATKFDNWVDDVLPEIFREDYVFLYEREGYPIRWKAISDPATWPEILR